MKVNLELDLTPEEMRRLFGLPDVAPVNDMLVDKLREQMEKGLDGTLLRNMMQSMVKGGTQGLEAYQTLLTSVFRMGRRSDTGDAPAPGPAASGPSGSGTSGSGTSAGGAAASGSPESSASGYGPAAPGQTRSAAPSGNANSGSGNM